MITPDAGAAPAEPHLFRPPARAVGTLRARAILALLFVLAFGAATLPAQRVVPAPLPSPTPTPVPPPAPDLVAAFDDMVADVLASPVEDRQARVHRWHREYDTPSPLERPDGRSVFWYLGDARTVGLLGGMVQWGEPLPMRRVGGTSLWMRETRFEPEARFDYLFVVDGEMLSDPRNPLIGVTPHGLGSEWIGRRYSVPGFRAAAITAAREQAALANAPSDGPKVISPGGEGESTRSFEIGDDLPEELRGSERRFRLAGRTILVHVPADYADNPTRRYPVVYMPADGERWRESARLPAALDWWASGRGTDRAEGAGQPVIAVMVEDPRDSGDIAASPETARWVGEELVPFVDRILRTRAERDGRVLLGAGWGATIALETAIEHRELFSKAALLSPRMRPRGRNLLDTLRIRPPLGVRLIVEIGSYETSYDGQDLVADARQLRAALGARPIEYDYREHPAGSSWGWWRDRAAYLMPELFISDQ